MKISSFLVFLAVASLAHGAAVLPNHEMLMRAKRDVLDFSSMNILDCFVPIGDGSTCATGSGGAGAVYPGTAYGGANYGSGSGASGSLPLGGSTAGTGGAYGGYGGYPGFGYGYGGYGFPSYGYGGFYGR